MSKEKDIEPKISKMIESQHESERNLYLKEENKELSTRVADKEQELEQKYDDDADTYESLFLLGVDPAGKTTAKCINELGEHIQSLESKLSTLLKASEGMEKALEQFQEVGDKIEHYDNGHECRVTTHAPTLKDNPEVFERCKVALADFRAVKETMEKGAGK